MLLLTDGNILVHNAYGQEWLLFQPDPNNGYAGGAWGAVSQMSVPRGFFAQSGINSPCPSKMSESTVTYAVVPSVGR